MAPVFGYWKIRALGQPVRLLLEYVGENYEDKTYTHGPAPDYLQKSDWLPVKYTLGLDFPNLPYYIDGDVKLTQTKAILYHIARKHDMCGGTDLERAHHDMLFNQVGDMRGSYWTFISTTFDTHKDQYMKALADQHKLLSDYLGSNAWLLGGQMTLSDIILYELLDIHLKLFPNCLKDFKNLQELHRRFEELPAIKKYMASPRFIKSPLNSPSAKWNA